MLIETDLIIRSDIVKERDVYVEKRVEKSVSKQDPAACCYCSYYDSCSSMQDCS